MSSLPHFARRPSIPNSTTRRLCIASFPRSHQRRRCRNLPRGARDVRTISWPSSVLRCEGAKGGIGAPSRLHCPEGLVFLHGRRQFSAIFWPGTHRFRLEGSSAPPQPPCSSQFPKSIHFSDPALFEATARKGQISALNNFHLMSRDRTSLHFAQKHFDARSNFVPDAAHALSRLVRDPGSGILTTCARGQGAEGDYLRASIAEYGRVATWH